MSDLPMVEAILERQGRFRELRNKLRTENAGKLAGVAEGPWLSLSRQLGSGGIELARRLGHELGWQVYDREIVRVIAENTHTRESVLSQMDEHATGPLKDYFRRLLDSSVPGHLPFMRETMSVVWGLARQGNAVIVGRGANWFLPPATGVRVRTIAPREMRVEAVAREEAVDRPVAQRTVDEDDRRRADFVRQVHRRDIEDPEGYDMILNLGALDLGTAQEIVLAALRRRVGLP
jgi:cytidylate kinase